MRKFDTVLFDLDGTITDPFEGIINSVIYALKKHSIEVPDRAELRCFIGPPLHTSFVNRFQMSEDEAEEMVKTYREYYPEKGIFECSLYPGIKELIINLKKSGKKVVLATLKPEPYAKKILKHFGLLEYFDIISATELNHSVMEKEEIIEKALACEKNYTAVMIGDRGTDIIGAKKTGIASIGVTFGYGTGDELSEADYLCDSVEEIEKILL